VTNVLPPAMARQFTILVVEDDGEVRDVVADILDTLNFKVLVARDGYDAIRLLTAYHVDVMFTDIVMPGLSGFELAAQAKLIEPSLRVLYMTGFDGNVPGREWALRHGKILQKPLRADELIAEIEDALAALRGEDLNL
jgi:CheY-like chemotaxis protein